jgi:hypothetical protein
MSDKRYKTIGQAGRELDDLVMLVERLIEKVLLLEEHVIELEAAANVRP